MALNQSKRSPIEVVFAGKSIPDAAQAIIEYIESPREKTTIRDFDYAAEIGRRNFLEGRAARITQSTIDAANRLMAAFHRTYTTGNPLDWFAAMENTAPWHLIESDHEFVSCDPKIVGGKYDESCELWYHFVDNRPSGIGPTQINKVLHQVNPNAFPIFDSRLNKKYSPFKTPLRIQIRSTRRKSSPFNLLTTKDGFGWEQFRLDMIEVQEKMPDIRLQIENLPCNNEILIEGVKTNVWAAQHLVDLRFADIWAWQ